MASPILIQCKLNNQQVYCLGGRSFKKNDTSFTITGSELTGAGIYDVIHTVKNNITSSYAYIEMRKLIEILIDAE